MRLFRRVIVLLVPFLLGTGVLFGQSFLDSESITIQGKGTAKTRTFALKDNWLAQVTSDAPIKVSSVSADGTNSVLVNFPAATPAPPVYTGSSALVEKGGSYTLTIETTGSWQITILEAGFVKDLAIGGSPAQPATPPAPATPTVPPSATSNSSPASGASTPMPYNNGMYPHPRFTTIASFHRTTDVDSLREEQTDSFTATTEWRLIWSTAKGVKITLIPSDGSPRVLVDDTSAGQPRIPENNNQIPENQAQSQFYGHPVYSPNTAMNGMSNMYHGVRMGGSGTYRLVVEGPGIWSITIASASMTPMPPPGSPLAGGNPAPAATTNAPPSPAAPVAPSNPAPIVKMSEDQSRAVVLIKGDNAQGTGFMIKTSSGPAVITNIHVIANNPNLKITTNTGALVTVLSTKGASDRDLAMLSIQDAGYSYLQFSSDISKDVQTGDEVITPGNSQGGEVMLNTGGKVLGIGPVRIEFDNPIYHGNSGGPVFHPKSGKVLGVVTEAIKVDTSDDLDKVSLANRNSAISGSLRYFGLRLDTIATWVPIDSRRFQIETTFLDEFHEQSRRLDAYLNHTEAERSEASRLYHADDKIMKANDSYLERSGGADTAQHIDLVRSLVFDLQCVADLNMEQVKDKNNFYLFDQDRASDEYAYRKALKTELDSISNNVERASFLPRSNN